MPSASVAKSPQVCVGLGHPTVRLFTKSSGPPTSRLKVELLYKSGNTQKTLTIAQGVMKQMPVLERKLATELQVTIPDLTRSK